MPSSSPPVRHVAAPASLRTTPLHRSPPASSSRLRPSLLCPRAPKPLEREGFACPSPASSPFRPRSSVAPSATKPPRAIALPPPRSSPQHQVTCLAAKFLSSSLFSALRGNVDQRRLLCFALHAARSPAHIDRAKPLASAWASPAADPAVLASAPSPAAARSSPLHRRPVGP